MINSKAGLFWIFSVAILVLSIGNPLYTIMLLVLTLSIKSRYARHEHEVAFSFMKMGLLFVIVSATYNGLFVHSGATVLFNLPDWPLIGGAITAEALVDGAAKGLTLAVLMVVFLTLLAIVSAGSLVSIIPGAFHDLSVVLIIALTYVPETKAHLGRIKEAQAIRGHQIRGLRDWIPLLVPLLIGSLERSIKIAETMAARGFGTTASKKPRSAETVWLTGSLGLIFSGWILVTAGSPIGGLLLFAGGSSVIILIWYRGRRFKRTSYVRERWQSTDVALVVCALLALIFLTFRTPLVALGSLQYSPYPALTLPDFNPVTGLLLLLLVLPVVVFPPMDQRAVMAENE